MGNAGNTAHDHQTVDRFGKIEGPFGHILRFLESSWLQKGKVSCFGEKARISFISPISEHFCGLCNRLRITAEGKLKLCLFSPHKTELDLLNLIRIGYSDEQIAESISKALLEKDFAHPEIEELINLKNNNIISLGG